MVISGCPAGVKYDEKILLDWLERRRPGRSQTVTARGEADQPEILSGVFEGRTLGTPICVIVRNKDARSSDYETLRTRPRAGHADDVWQNKFGVSDHRGGGRSSGRETLARVIGGAFAQMFLNSVSLNVRITSSPLKIGEIQITDDEAQKAEVEKYLLGLKAEGDSVGGIVRVTIEGHGAGLGQPVFRKLKSDLAAAMMSVGAVTGVELGGGFALAEKKGTEVHGRDESVYGGIRGGISTGEKIVLQVAFKPTSSILDVAKKGRHDPCIVIRAQPVLEAMSYLVIADHLLWSRLDRA